MRQYFACFVLILTVATTQSSTIYIPDDYSTIQAGVDAALDGDIVLVRPGNYPEHILLGSASITLASTHGARATFISVRSV